MVNLYLYSNIVIEYVVRLPASKSLGYWWNVGRILGLVLGLQIITGRVFTIVILSLSVGLAVMVVPVLCIGCCG